MKNKKLKCIVLSVVMIFLNVSVLVQAKSFSRWFNDNKSTIGKVAAGVGAAAVVGGSGYALHRSNQSKVNRAVDRGPEYEIFEQPVVVERGPEFEPRVTNEARLRALRDDMFY